MISGHCNCGSVRFEVHGTPAGVFVCHCSICRRATGANGMAVVVVCNESFKWIQGKENIAQWAKPNSEWETWFCRICGSRLPGRNDAQRMFVPAGLLPGHGLGLTVKAHIWVHSRAEWDEVGDGGTRFAERFGGSTS